MTGGRVERQKRMLVAIIGQLKHAGMLKSVPDLLTEVWNVYTNVSMEQALALANFALHIDTAEIGQFSLYGPYRTVMQWNFTLVDQENRVAIIREVYGVEVQPYNDCTL